MGLHDDLEKEVKQIFRSAWSERDGYVIPDDSSIKLNNDAVKIDATVLYADLNDSTDLVNNHTAQFSAEIYKTFLVCAARIIREEGGAITAYDGDRIMAVFIGKSKNTSSVKAALKINYAVKNIANIKLAEQYSSSYRVKHVVGIDTSKLFVAKTGIRSYNDLVWVGNSANYAAKLSNLNEFPTYITSEIYNNIADVAKFSNGTDMWNARTWTPANKPIVYGSTYWWKLS